MRTCVAERDLFSDEFDDDLGELNVAQQNGLADVCRQARMIDLIVAECYLVSVTRAVFGVSAAGFLSLRTSAF